MKKFIIFLSVSFFLFLLDSGGGLSWFRQRFNRFFSPWRTVLLKKTSPLSPVSPLAQKEKNLSLCQAKVVELEEENRAARRLLGASLPPRMRFEPAKLLGRGDNEAMIDQGKAAGISLGAAVLDGEILLGEVSRVNPFSSQIRFLSHPQTRLLVGVWSQEKDWRSGQAPVVKAILRGGRPLVLEEILSQEKVVQGDLVISLDQGGVFLIGRVSRVWLTDDGLFKKAAVEWLTDPKKLVTVFVVKK